MALTDIDTIKKLMQFQAVSIKNVYNEMIELNTVAYSQLQNAAITSSTDVVKLLEINTPFPDPASPITLNAAIPVSLNKSKIMWDSVVVASDALLTTVYIENLDYVIDYFNGTVMLADPVGSIPDGTAIFVWYLYFTVKSRTTDYVIDNDSGRIARRTGTTIPDGAKVYVDYLFSAVSPTDSVIQEAIRQAEAFIVPRLKAGYTYLSDDEGLKSASTNYTMYLICLSQAFNELANNPKDNSDDIARRWQELADKYMKVAFPHLSKYLYFTQAEYAGLIQNRFSSSGTRTLYSPSVTPKERKY
jgi:hypothetical protein